MASNVGKVRSESSKYSLSVVCANYNASAVPHFSSLMNSKASRRALMRTDDSYRSLNSFRRRLRASAILFIYSMWRRMPRSFRCIELSGL